MANRFIGQIFAACQQTHHQNVFLAVFMAVQCNKHIINGAQHILNEIFMCLRVRVCVCVCSEHIFAIHYAHITVWRICICFTPTGSSGDMNFSSSLGAENETKDARKNVLHTLLRTLRPEATALYGFIFFNILASKILYYIMSYGA